VGCPCKEAAEFSPRCKIETPFAERTSWGASESRAPQAEVHRALQSPGGLRVALPGVEAPPAAGAGPWGLRAGETALPELELGRAEPVGLSPPRGSCV